MLPFARVQSGYLPFFFSPCLHARPHASGVPVILLGDPAGQSPGPRDRQIMSLRTVRDMPARIVNYAGILAETTVPPQSKRGDAMG